MLEPSHPYKEVATSRGEGIVNIFKLKLLKCQTGYLEKGRGSLLLYGSAILPAGLLVLDTITLLIISIDCFNPS